MSSKTSFTGTEDFSVLVIGTFLLLVGLTTFFINDYGALNEEQMVISNKMEAASKAEFKTVEWYDHLHDLEKIEASSSSTGKFLKKLTDKPGGWKTDPTESMSLSEENAAEVRENVNEAYSNKMEAISLAREQALVDQAVAAQQGFADNTLNTKARLSIDQWLAEKASASGLQKKHATKPYSKYGYLFLLFLTLGALFGFGHIMMGGKFATFFKGFFFVFFIASLSHFLAGQESVNNLGMGYAAWAIVIGLIISNTIGTPEWVKPALSSELYIKTGLIILGAEILFGKILAIGLPGIFVAWVVTPIVLITTYWFGQKVLKIKSKTLNMTVSADMSVCGVSAAVATAAACKASKEELTLAVGLSMIFTSVMMIVLPLAINAMGMPEVLGGAWIGGTIDATGAVVAAGAFLGDDALNVAATIKMIQNILIGIIAFGVAVYFSKQSGKEEGVNVGWEEIWRRFPKFILGFIGASVLFSLIYAMLDDNMAYAILDKGVIGSFTKNLRGWLFCIAFVSIGLSTNFKELKSHFTGGKPLILYVCGQTLNLALTLLMAYIMFYLVFPHITENI